MKAVLLVPASGDPHGLLHRVHLPHSHGVNVEHGAPPVYCDLVPLPDGLAPAESTPCSECPDVGMEGWKLYQRSCDGVCSIRGSVCVRAAERGARGLRRSLVLAWGGKPIPDGIFRAWLHADDVLGDVLLDMVHAESLDEIVEIAGGLCRNGEPLGTLVTL